MKERTRLVGTELQERRRRAAAEVEEQQERSRLAAAEVEELRGVEELERSQLD